jgi:NAD(P)-dependent dehydrogenase (short-subunit alcohol dehydrogenase family)
MSDFRLDGQVALVTGASRNIGAAIATAFAEAGSDLVLVARGADGLAAIAERLTGSHPGRRVLTITADLSVPEDIDRIAASALGEFGVVDTVVNNAATTGTPAPSLEVADSAMEDVFRTNVFAPFRVIQALAPAMLESGRGGSIINVLSGAGFLPVPRTLPYGASKAALWLMTRSLAVELAPSIRVNALVPGLVTDDGEPRYEGQQQMVEATVPFGRMGRADEVAGAAVYLASPAASYTSGAVIACNGARLW